jgi:DUF1365 family protein
MNRESNIYVGSVMHCRLTPHVHRFRYRGFWLLLDLDELTRPPARLALFSHNRFNIFSLHDRDYGDGSDTPLRVQIDCKLAEAGIAFTSGTVRLLCMPRMFGYSFNPLSIYFCAHQDGTPAAVVYEVHNTFGERHNYVIPVAAGDGIRHSCQKAFYVSPFLDMDLRYDFAVRCPDERLTVSIRASRIDETVMIARLSGDRRSLTDLALLRLLFTMPFVTFKVMAAIHWEALCLWTKGLRLNPHPSPHGPTNNSIPRWANRPTQGPLRQR